MIRHFDRELADDAGDYVTWKPKRRTFDVVAKR